MNLDDMTVEQLKRAIERIACLAEQFEKSAVYNETILAQQGRTGGRDIERETWARGLRYAHGELTELIDNCTGNWDMCHGH